MRQFHSFSFFLTTKKSSPMFTVARSLRSAVSRSGSYAVCIPTSTLDASCLLVLLGPSPFLDREEHELEGFGYAYVSCPSRSTLTIL